MDNIHGSRYALKLLGFGRRGIGHQISREHVRGEAVLVAEQGVAHLDERRLKIQSVQLLSRYLVVVREEAQFLPETAAGVEEVSAGAEARERRSVIRVVGDGVVEETYLANAGVGPDSKCFVADGSDVGEDLVSGNTTVVFEKGAAGGGDGGDVFGIPGDLGGAISLGLALKDTGAVISSPFC